MTLQPFQPVDSKAVPLLLDNLDTDVITPIGRVLQGREATVTYAFEPLRFDAEGKLRPDCPLNDPALAGAEILLGGANFACGSSRETAVWAVAGLGFRVVIAPSFGDIFYANCFQNGVLPIVLPEDAVAGLARHAGDGGRIRVDLQAQLVSAGDLRHAFAAPPLRKEALLLGLDDLGLILRRCAASDRFEAQDRLRRPWVYEFGNG